MVRDEQVQAVEAFLSWEAEHEVEVIATEMTVFGPHYAGTFDAVLKIDGVTYMVDWKTSKAVRETHISQMAAYSAAETAFVEVPAGTDGAHEVKNSKGTVGWFKEVAVPGFQKHAIIRIRPDDVDAKGNHTPAHVEMVVLDDAEIEAGYLLFQSALNARLSTKLLTDATKARKVREESLDF